MKKLLLLVASVVTLCACSQQSQPQLLDADNFVATVDGKQTSLYTLKGGNLVMQVTDFGGRVVTLWTPDRVGVMEDIVLGYNNIDTYINNPVSVSWEPAWVWLPTASARVVLPSMAKPTPLRRTTTDRIFTVV